MRLPIEYVRPDHTNSDDIMPEKLLQNGLFQGHWDNRLKSFYPVDGNTGIVTSQVNFHVSTLNFIKSKVYRV